MKYHRWFGLTEQERERRELDRIATRLIKNAELRRHNGNKKPTKPAPEPTLPRRLTLADLPQLRKRGLLP